MPRVIEEKVGCGQCCEYYDEHFMVPIGHTEYPEIVGDGRICDSCEYDLYSKEDHSWKYPRDPMDDVIGGFGTLLLVCLAIMVGLVIYAAIAEKL